MLTDDELDAMRSDVASSFADICSVHAEAPRPTFNPATGATTVTSGSPVYTGLCLIGPTGGERVVLVGGEPVTLRTYTVRLPWDADINVESGSISDFTVLTSPPPLPAPATRRARSPSSV